MMNKNYQRRFLRAPLRAPVLYADGNYVLKAHTINVSEGGMLLDELPRFPERDEIPLLVCIPSIPELKNLELLKLQTFSVELFKKHVIRVRARVIRRQELSQNLDNLFRSQFALEFVHISEMDQKHLENFIHCSSSNLVYLQTLIDAYNSSEEMKLRVRALARILGYDATAKISEIRAKVAKDYKSLTWL